MEEADLIRQAHSRSKMAPLIIIFGCYLMNALAQQSARSYYEEAKSAGGLPNLPYVCFRNTMEVSGAQIPLPHGDSTFAMVGTSQQIAEKIKEKDPAQEGTVKWNQLMHADWLYIDGFDHGIDGGSHLFTLRDATNPSRADWVFEGVAGADKGSVVWDFNINWGTLRFRERISMGSDALTYYGRCESVAGPNQ
jgi:hypothetical protein